MSIDPELLVSKGLYPENFTPSLCHMGDMGCSQSETNNIFLSSKAAGEVHENTGTLKLTHYLEKLYDALRAGDVG